MQKYKCLTDEEIMRTTLNIDPALLSAAKRLAVARSVAVGDIISELAHAGLVAQSQTSLKRKSGFPVFAAPPGAPLIGLDDVKRDEDGSDQN